ncbi:MAG: hypothetical protein ACFFAN_05250 [Promethearchaeota archaeon]
MINIPDCILLKITQNLVLRYLDLKITNEIVRKLVGIMEKKKKPFLFKHNRNRTPYNSNIKLLFEDNLFTQREIEADKNSLDPDDITDKAAVGFIITFFLYIRPNISTIKVCLKGQGYDYYCREENRLIKIEISGVNVENKNAFYGRVYQKKTKFEKKIFEPRGDEEIIGIVDFFYYKYKIWNVR